MKNFKDSKSLFSYLKGLVFSGNIDSSTDRATSTSSTNLKVFIKRIPYIAAGFAIANNSFGLWQKIQPNEEQIILDSSPPIIIIYNFQASSDLDKGLLSKKYPMLIDIGKLSLQGNKGENKSIYSTF
ncbi:MAG: hypothetical protein ACFB02_17130 [Mastigocoleus sp.]